MPCCVGQAAKPFLAVWDVGAISDWLRGVGLGQRKKRSSENVGIS